MLFDFSTPKQCAAADLFFQSAQHFLNNTHAMLCEQSTVWQQFLSPDCSLPAYQAAFSASWITADITALLKETPIQANHR